MNKTSRVTKLEYIFNPAKNEEYYFTKIFQISQ